MAAADDLDVAGAGVRRGAFAAFTTADAPEGFFAFVSLVVREVEVTAFFTVAFVATFLVAFVVLVPAALRVAPARFWVPDRGDLSTGARGPAGDGAARPRVAAFGGAAFALRAVPTGVAARALWALPARLPFATGATSFFDAAERLDALFAPCDARAVGGDFRVDLDAPAVVAGVIWSSSPSRRTARARDGGSR